MYDGFLVGEERVVWGMKEWVRLSWNEKKLVRIGRLSWIELN